MINLTTEKRIAMPTFSAADYEETPGCGFLFVQMDGNSACMSIAFSEDDGHIFDIMIDDDDDDPIYVWPENQEEKNAILAVMNQHHSNPFNFCDSCPLFFDTETEEIITVDALSVMFCEKSAEEKAEYHNSFPRWLDEISGKNGTLIKF